MNLQPLVRGDGELREVALDGVGVGIDYRAPGLALIAIGAHSVYSGARARK